MDVARITFSLDHDLAASLRELARTRAMPVSNVVAEAVGQLVRRSHLHEFVREWEEEFGVISEETLQRVSAETGLPYIPPPAT